MAIILFPAIQYYNNYAVVKISSSVPDFNIPETLEDENELNMDAAIWQDASHERGGDWMGHPVTPTACTLMETPRYLTGGLTGFIWLLQLLYT